MCSLLPNLKYFGRSHPVAAALHIALFTVLWNLSLAPAKAQIERPTAEQESSTSDLRERLRRLQEGARAMPEPLVPGPLDDRLRFPSLGSLMLDAQLSRYLSYVETVGTPDILIVGSSRSLQGIDPTELRYRLSVEGYDDLKVYNFSVNGATAQVVNFIVSELLPNEPPGELPKVILWGDGSRAFNSGRRDRTWESLRSSAGYQAVRRGEQPNIEQTDAEQPNIEQTDTERLNIEQLGIDRLGFSAVRDRFDPATYYRRFARVQGRYDGAYSPFILTGPQTKALAQLSGFLAAQGSQLVFINLPLSASYLDSYRLSREGQFREFLRTQSDRHGFGVIDLLTQWASQPALFADPSHINQYGAAAIAQQLAHNATFLSAIAPLDGPLESPADDSAEPSTPDLSQTLLKN